MDVIQAYEHELAITQGNLARAYMAIERVRELHKPKQLSIVWTGCEICWEHPNTRGTSYPCPTIKALDGEE